MEPPDASLFIGTELFPLCGLTGNTFTLCFVGFTLSAKMIKAFVEAAASLFHDFKNKLEILSSIKASVINKYSYTAL